MNEQTNIRALFCNQVADHYKAIDELNLKIKKIFDYLSKNKDINIQIAKTNYKSNEFR
jgi:hypothetical protein